MNGTRASGGWLSLAAALISGVAVFLNGYGVKAFGDPTLYTTAKNAVAAVVLLAVVGALSRSRDRVLTRPVGRSQWLPLAFVGLVGGSVPFLLFFEGLARATSVEAAFVHKTLVLWVALLAVPLLAEKVGALQWAAIGLLLAGQAALAGGLGTPFSIAWGTGELMVLAATLCWSVETVLVKRLLSGLSSWTVGVTRMGVGSAVLLGWVLLRGDLGALARMDAGQLGWVVLTGLVLAGYVGTWFAALARAQAVDVTAVLVLGAVLTAVLSAATSSTSLSAQTGGLVLVTLGAVLVLARMLRPRRALVAM